MESTILLRDLYARLSANHRLLSALKAEVVTLRAGAKVDKAILSVLAEDNKRRKPTKKPGRAVEAPRGQYKGTRRPDKPGHVYIIQTLAGLYKIGATIRLKQRISDYATLGAENFSLIHTIECQKPFEVESKLHRKFTAHRENRELFRLSDEHLAWLKSIPKM